MSIFEYNGGSVVGMVGKDCVGIAADRRFGKQMLTLTNDFQRVFKMQDNIIMGLSGLGTDVQTFSARMEQQINLYTLKENKPMKAETFCNMVAYSLFERRYSPPHSDLAPGSSNPSSQDSTTECPSWPATIPSVPSA